MDINNRSSSGVLFWGRIEHNAKQQTFLAILGLVLKLSSPSAQSLHTLVVVATLIITLTDSQILLAVWPVWVCWPAFGGGTIPGAALHSRATRFTVLW